MATAVKTGEEMSQATFGEVNVLPSSTSDTMGFVRYYVRAAFEALLGANLQAQVVAISVLPPNLEQPTDVSAQ